MRAARALALVVFAAAVVAFVTYVWTLDPNPAPYTPGYPSTTLAPAP